MAIGYDEKVWRMIRELWEVSPKSTSVQSILNQVSDLLCCDVPSAPTVHVKMKKEQWRKLSQKELRERAKMPTNKSANKGTNISRKKDEKNIDKSSGNADLISSSDFSKKGANKSVENDVDLLPPSIEILVRGTASKKANMIGALRAQALNVFNITNICVQGLADFITELELIDPETCEEAEISALDWKLRAFERAANILESLSRTNEKNIKMHIGLYGYTGDDFVDRAEIEAEKAEIMKDLDVLLEEKKQLMAEQQALAFSRDLSAIEDKMRNG